MIKELRLTNWKSFSPSTIYLDPLTVLIGTNASGKSNLLDAFYFLSQLATGKPVETVINEIRGGREWLIRKGKRFATLTVVVARDIHSIEYQYSIELRIADDKRVYIDKEALVQVDQSISVLTNSLDSSHPERKPKSDNLFRGYLTDITKPYVDVLSRRSSQGPEKTYQFSRVSSVLSQMGSKDVLKYIKDGVSFVQQELSNIFVLNPVPNNMRGYSSLSETLKSDASNMAGVLSAMDEAKRIQVEEKLTRYLKPLPEKDVKRVWTEKYGPFGTDAMLLCKEQWRDGEETTIDSRSMSDGTLRFLAIATAMMTRPQGSLLIVEEIDNGLHPSRTKELITMLKNLGNERSIDVLCTTHNPVMIDNLGIDMLPIVFFVKRDVQTGGSVVEPVEEKENLPKLLAHNSVGGLMTEGVL